MDNSPNQDCSVEAQTDLQVVQLGLQPTEAVVTGAEDHRVRVVEDEDGFFSEPTQYASWLSYLESFILGPNQRNQIWRLRLLAGISLYIAALAGIHFYPDVRKASDPYQMVMLTTTIGTPIVVGAISLCVSSWRASVPNGRSNCITGLSVLNIIMLCGLAIYVMHKRGTGN
ncbi:hypothetical protein FCM35_KLT17325 [Carex littledalei]|uniref:Uncharacterized protein n=1 Tax=Carex littledalei TaxID=544730 RepID=A0A833VWL5_9POAL|nr:hypothetical protein FCM35_KLT17325 [Carex littledalei]